ncbi:Mitochondrial ATPase complex subunit ATP10 [Rhynchospora pubera]|uniref:Mitochondrial ATPase complex subunit ATP10 n=1 Tax=Rhynchospora pubera TaxID=906938 RepID=A0AAV8CCS7_9POAL|nr:Mitochondrial ATPase complex subunit ATP10 [Rhynchospora pubera]
MLRRVASRSSPIAVFQARLFCPTGPTDQTLRTIPYFHVTTRGFLDLHKMTSKEAIEKEKARLSDELSRGYFADISEMRKNGGKIAVANKILIPEVAAVKFPELEVNLTDCTTMKLPVVTGDKNPDVSLMCLSFRESSQRMVESWSLPFLDKFGGDTNIQIYEVSFVDSWLLSLGPIKRSFIKIMKKSSKPHQHIVYALGDHYYFRKQLHILNLLTGYVFLLDRVGRIRWQGFGTATDEELSNLLSCTSVLLDDK